MRCGLILAVISARDLRAIARARLRDAQVFLRAKRFDGAYYLSGYAVELVLKARICRTLKWEGFPQTAKDFEGLQSLKTHNLEILLKLSGIETRVTTKYLDEWSEVIRWNPEKRYQALGQIPPQDVTNMLMCVERLLEVL
ncbi:conserved hypothetical protein [Candidatus Sulfopaludibacter sp. SbA4]|nr:conserved hypothetical protein [Candidatus Sulfopaludibacter sp. SbA4]